MKPTVTRTQKAEEGLAAFAAALRARARQKGRKARLSDQEVEAVATRVALLDMAAREVGAYAPRPPGQEGALSEQERMALDEGFGGKPRPVPPGPDHPHTRYLAELARLRADSMSVEETARLLGVNESRIRQRLGGRQRTLLGIKVGRSWRVFRYQFDGKELVPGLDRVIAAMPRGREPVGDHHWLTRPDPELALDDDTLVSPLTWLRMGRDPELVVTTACHLDRGI
jgi:hypothetical protein